MRMRMGMVREILRFVCVCGRVFSIVITCLWVVGGHPSLCPLTPIRA